MDFTKKLLLMNYFFAFWEKKKKFYILFLMASLSELRRLLPSCGAAPLFGPVLVPHLLHLLVHLLLEKRKRKKDFLKIISHGRRGEVSKQQAGLGKKKWKSYPSFFPPLPTKESGARNNTDEKGRERKGGKNSLGEKREASELQIAPLLPL